MIVKADVVCGCGLCYQLTTSAIDLTVEEKGNTQSVKTESCLNSELS